MGNVGTWAQAEVSVAGVTKYYTFGGQRIAMRMPQRRPWVRSRS